MENYPAQCVSKKVTVSAMACSGVRLSKLIFTPEARLCPPQPSLLASVATSISSQEDLNEHLICGTGSVSMILNKAYRPGCAILVIWKINESPTLSWSSQRALTSLVAYRLRIPWVDFVRRVMSIPVHWRLANDWLLYRCSIIVALSAPASMRRLASENVRAVADGNIKCPVSVESPMKRAVAISASRSAG